MGFESTTYEHEGKITFAQTQEIYEGVSGHPIPFLEALEIHAGDLSGKLSLSTDLNERPYSKIGGIQDWRGDKDGESIRTPHFRDIKNIQIDGFSLARWQMYGKGLVRRDVMIDKDEGRDVYKVTVIAGNKRTLNKMRIKLDQILEAA